MGSDFNSTTTTTTTMMTTIPNIVLDVSVTNIINPYASYIGLAVALISCLLVIMARLIVSIETPRSDLILFNSTPNKNAKPLISKQMSTQAAVNNIHLAVAVGLMAAPANYEQPLKYQNMKNEIAAGDEMNAVKTKMPKKL